MMYSTDPSLNNPMMSSWALVGPGVGLRGSMQMQNEKVRPNNIIWGSSPVGIVPYQPYLLWYHTIPYDEIDIEKEKMCTYLSTYVVGTYVVKKSDAERRTGRRCERQKNINSQPPKPKKNIDCLGVVVLSSAAKKNETPTSANMRIISIICCTY